MLNFFSKLKNAFQKTNNLLVDKIQAIFKGKIDEEALDELENLLYEANLGSTLAHELVEKVKQHLRKGSSLSKESVIELIKEELIKQLTKEETSTTIQSKPHVILVVGINGSGKTTSVAKLAYYYKTLGKKVLVVAADTFRAAATQQLDLWSAKIGVDIIKGQMGSDPAAVTFDAMQAAKARNCDIVIVDTAGRLQVKSDLMNELVKIKKVCNKIVDLAPHETLLVLDATLGQNAIDQAKTFHQFTPLSGIILTKVDGTNKAGAAIALQKECPTSIKYVGMGEQIEEFAVFNKEDFVNALLT